MELKAISFPVVPELFSQAGSKAAPTFSTQFSNLMQTGMSEINQQIKVADQAVQDLALGQTANLHQVMIDMEQARLSLQLFLQVRNHVMDAYKEVMQMQV